MVLPVVEKDAVIAPIGVPRTHKGRTAGVPNRTTAAIKNAILEAFHKSGGVEYLLRVAESDPRTFCALLSRILPAEIKADVTLNTDLARAIADARQRQRNAQAAPLAIVERETG